MSDPKIILAKDSDTPPLPSVKLADDFDVPPSYKKNQLFSSKTKNKSKSSSLSFNTTIAPSSIFMNKEAQLINKDSGNPSDFQTNRVASDINISGKFSPFEKYKPFKVVGSVGDEVSYNRDISPTSNNLINQSSPYQQQQKINGSLGVELSPDFLRDKKVGLPYVASQIAGSSVGVGVEYNGDKFNPYTSFSGQLSHPFYKDKSNIAGIIINPINATITPTDNKISGGVGLSGENKKLGLSGYVKAMIEGYNNSNDDRGTFVEPLVQYGLKKEFNESKKNKKEHRGGGQNVRYL